MSEQGLPYLRIPAVLFLKSGKKEKERYKNITTHNVDITHRALFSGMLTPIAATAPVVVVV